MSEPTGGSGGSGSQIENLKIGVDTGEVASANINLDNLAKKADAAIDSIEKFGTATVRSITSVKDMNTEVAKNSEWVATATNKYAQLVAALEAQSKAEQDAKKAQEETNRAIQARVDAGARLLARLEEEVRVFGMNREELQRYHAAQLGVANDADKLITKLAEMREASKRYNVVIKEGTDIEKERQKWEENNATALNAQRIRALNDQIKQAESTSTSLLAQKRRELAEQAQLEESASASLLAQKRRALAEQAALEESASTSLLAQKRRAIADQAAAEEAARTSLNAQRIRSINEQAAAEESARTALNAQRIRAINDNKKAAIKAAEDQAVEEMRWQDTSLRHRVKTLEQIQRMQANPNISGERIESIFGRAAMNDLQNYNRLAYEYSRTAQGIAEAHRNGAGHAMTFSQAMEQIRFSSARARSELIVIAHEMVTGNWTRVPASMMVLGEYTNAGALAFSKLGASILGGAVALGVIAIEIGKGILQQHELNNALNRTNGAAGATISTLTQMAETAGGIHGNMTAAYRATTELAASGMYTAEQIGQISRAAAQVEHAFRVDVGTTIKEFEALVVKGSKVGAVATYGVSRAVQMLDEKYHFLNATQMQHIVQLESEGKQREASALAIKLFAKEHEDAATRSVQYTGYIQTAWHNIGNAIDSAMQKLRDWGATDTLHQQLQEVNDKIRNSYDRPSGFSGAGDAERAKLVEERKKIQAAIEAEGKAAEKVAAQKRKDAEANRELTTMRIEDVRLLRKSEGELERALEEHRQRANTIEAAIPGWKEKNAQYLADREAAIVREHTRNKSKIQDDGRKQDLQSALAHEQAQYEMMERQFNSELRMINAAQKRGSQGQEEAYQQRAALRQKELEAVDKLERDKLAVLDKYKPKNGKDAANTAKLRQQAIDDAKAMRQAIEIAGKEDDKLNSEAIFDKWIDGINKAGDAELKQIQRSIDAQRKRNAEIGKTREQIDLSQAEVERGATRELESQLEAIDALLLKGQIADETGLIYVEMSDRLRKGYEAEAARIREIIAARKELATLNEQGAGLERLFALQKEYDKEWERTYKKIEDGLYSAITGGGDNALKRLIREFKQQFARLILQPIISPIANAITGFFNPNASQAGGSAGSIAAAAGGGDSKLGKALNIASTLSTAYKMAAGGFAGAGAGLAGSLGTGISTVGGWLGSAGMSSFGAGMSASVAGSEAAAMYASASTSGNLAAGASAGHAAGTVLGAAATVAAGVAAGLTSGKMISNGYSAWGNSGNRAVNTGTAAGTAIGAVMGGPVGAAIGAFIGGTLGGAWNKAFGHRPKEVVAMGLRGTVSETGASGETYADWKKEGGWFRSDKRGTEKSAMALDVQNTLTNGVQELKAMTTLFAESLNIKNGSMLNNYSKSFNLDFGKDGKKAEEAIKGLFESIGDEMALTLVPNIRSFSRSGETAAVTLQRLSETFTLTNDVAMTLGKTVEQMWGSKGLTSEAARSRLVNLAGGASNLSSITGSYANNFLNEEQRLSPVRSAVVDAMKELNLAHVDTREEFKSTVDALNLTKEADAKLFVSLMQLSDAFALVYADSTGMTKTMKEIADERKALQEELDELTLTEAQLMAKQRDSYAESNRALFDQVQAAKKAKEANEKAKESLTSFIDKMKSFAESVGSINDKLKLGTLSTLTPEQQYAEARRQMDETFALARSGDAGAQSRWENAQNTFLELSQKLNSGDTQYEADLAKAMRQNDELEKWAVDSTTVAQNSLDMLTRQYATLGDINNVLNSIAQGGQFLPSAQGTGTMSSSSPLVSSSGTLNYDLVGTAITVPLVAAIKALKEEVATLRAEQTEQTGALIQSNVQATVAAADATVTGVREVALEESYMNEHNKRFIR